MKTALALLALVTIAAAPPPAPQPLGETLVQPTIPGFKLGLSNGNAGGSTQQYVRESESVQSWTDMITVQSIKGRGDWVPGVYLSGYGQTFMKRCPKAQHGRIGTGIANGYPAAILAIQCPMSPDKKPESVFLRAVQGKDAFYLIQFAIRRIPSRNEVIAIDGYLQAVTLCDVRDSRHPCPALEGRGAPTH
jgi:hypothetical protein